MSAFVSVFCHMCDQKKHKKSTQQNKEMVKEKKPIGP